MQGDFSRNSDDPHQHYSGVLMQQGRVQLDADWNEQWKLQTRALRTALRDLIGPHGGPENNVGFAVTQETGKLHVGSGAYYVDGLRVEVRAPRNTPAERALSFDWAATEGKYFVYLELWERHVNVIEDPELREVALLGPDTCTRAQVVWAVKVQSSIESSTKPGKRGKADDGTAKLDPSLYSPLLEKLKKPTTLCLAARALRDQEPAPCAQSAEARYRGPENQLYRVEVHGYPLPVVKSRGSINKSSPAVFYFKWSRENGSVVFPIRSCTAPEKNTSSETTTVTVQLGHLGRDPRYGLVPGDIVEFVDDSITRPRSEVLESTLLDRGSAGELGCVRRVDPELNEVEVEVFSGDELEIADRSLHPHLRRWDQREPRNDKDSRPLVTGAIAVSVEDLGATWFDLEDGVQVQFGPKPEQPGKAASVEPHFHVGDYWQIPARVATGDVEWPADKRPQHPHERQPRLLPPLGPERHYAPLAWIDLDSQALDDLRSMFLAGATPLQP